MELQRYCANGDTGSVASVAHKLKSSSRTVGAVKLAACCTDIDQAARACRVAYLKKQAIRLDRIYRSTEEAIRRYLAEAAPHSDARTEPLN